MKRRHAFSLVELLLILALLAMLLSFMLPAAVLLRKNAERTQCVNNVKQLALAFNDWRSENANMAFQPADWRKALNPYFEGNARTLLCPTISSTPAVHAPVLWPTATAKSCWDVTLTPASRVIDGSGLSEKDMHSDDYRHMWLSDDSGVSGQWLCLNLEGLYKIDHLRIWNYNQKGQTGRGVQSCDIEVSLNNREWKTVRAGVKLKETSGHADVNFEMVELPGATSTRYVRLLIDANFGKDKLVGLSEVQVIGTYEFPEPTHYGINAYVGTVRRYPNTSGTILFLEYNQPIADMTSPEKYPNFMRPSGVSGRHPPPMLTVGFIDGHVDLFAPSAVNPATIGREFDELGEEMWNNYPSPRKGD